MDALLVMLTTAAGVVVWFMGLRWRPCMDDAYVRGFEAALRAHGIRAPIPDREPRHPDDAGA